MKKELIVLYRKLNTNSKSRSFQLLSLFSYKGRIDSGRIAQLYREFFKSDSRFSEKFIFDSTDEFKNFINLVAHEYRLTHVKFLDLKSYYKIISECGKQEDFSRIIESIDLHKVQGVEGTSLIDRIFSF